MIDYSKVYQCGGGWMHRDKGDKVFKTPNEAAGKSEPAADTAKPEAKLEPAADTAKPKK